MSGRTCSTLFHEGGLALTAESSWSDTGDDGIGRLPGFATESRMHLHIPVLAPKGPKLSLGTTPSPRKADERVVVVAPKARRAPIGPLVPGIHGCAHGGMIEVLERHQDVRIVVACCGKTAVGMSEHLPETRPGAQRSDTRSVVDYTVLGEQFNDLVVEPVVEAVRVAVDEIDDLVLIDQLPNRGLDVTVHEPSWVRRAIRGQAGTVASSSQCRGEFESS